MITWSPFRKMTEQRKDGDGKRTDLLTGKEPEQDERL